MILILPTDCFAALIMMGHLIKKLLNLLFHHSPIHCYTMKLIYLLLFILLLQTVHAQTNLIQNINARHTISLDGRWHYIIDRFETGFRGFQGATADEHGLSGFFENKQQQQPSELVEY